MAKQKAQMIPSPHYAHDRTKHPAGHLTFAAHGLERLIVGLSHTGLEPLFFPFRPTCSDMEYHKTGVRFACHHANTKFLLRLMLRGQRPSQSVLFQVSETTQQLRTVSIDSESTVIATICGSVYQCGWHYVKVVSKVEFCCQ